MNQAADEKSNETSCEKAADRLGERGDEADGKVNVLLVDDQPDKLLAYEVILGQLGENLVKTSSAREALQFLLKNDVAVVLIDVCMPELDGFQLAAMIRDHPRFAKTAIIFISAIHLTEVDRLRGYEMGAVDYVPVPVVPEVLRAKVRIFCELFRKTRALERLNSQLERRVVERTAELEASNLRVTQSEQGRSLALAAGQMGSWDWDLLTDEWKWDEGQHRIFGVDPGTFKVSAEGLRALIHPDDWRRLEQVAQGMTEGARTYQAEFRVLRPNGQVRWCIGSAAASVDASGKVVRVSGVTIDVTDRKEAEERQVLLAREVDHRARNALAVIQSIIRLTRAKTVEDYVQAIEGRIKALARAHTLLSDSRWNGADLATLVADELAPYRAGDKIQCVGPDISLQPATAQGLALALHELATNAAKHGALSSPSGKIRLVWELHHDALMLHWDESGGPAIAPPSARNFGLKVIVASIEQQLGGRAEFDWNPKGLRCVFSIPRSELTKSRTFSLARNGVSGNGATIDLNQQERPRVLLVEDEALVAMMIAETLADFGFQVLGPLSTASEALAAARERHLDAAVLDINLGDGLVYTVAEILVKRGVPFVFVTGYDAESVDPRFDGAPILQKPIERDALRRVFVQEQESQTVPQGRDLRGPDHAVAVN
jgi:two-component sensor histidine kinase/DNA-binding response OmpR family regulator